MVHRWKKYAGNRKESDSSFYVDYLASPMSRKHSAIQIDNVMIIASQIKALP